VLTLERLTPAAVNPREPFGRRDHMRILRSAVPLVACFALLALTACGAGDPAAAPTATSTASPAPDGGPSPTASPTQHEGGAIAAGVVVTAATLSVFAADGRQLFGTGYDGEVETTVDALTGLLGDPVVTTTAGVGSGCDTDQTMYDYGGLLLRSPGLIGTVGAWEAEVTGAATAGGVPVSTVGGQQIGATLAAFEAAIGDEVVVFGDYSPNAWFAFDLLNPEAPDYYDWVGTFARFDSGILVGFNTPSLIHADC
jgi:hypothetical protein